MVVLKVMAILSPVSRSSSHSDRLHLKLSKLRLFGYNTTTSLKCQMSTPLISVFDLIRSSLSFPHTKRKRKMSSYSHSEKFYTPLYS